MEPNCSLQSASPLSLKIPTPFLPPTRSLRLNESGWSSPDSAPAAAVFRSSARRGTLLAVLGHQYPRRHGGILQRVDGRRRHQSTVSPSSSLTPMRLRLTLPAVLTPTCASIRITGKRAGHEELLPSPPRLQSPSVASSGARCQRGSFWSNPATNRRIRRQRGQTRWL
jgi:hypothetical protein